MYDIFAKTLRKLRTERGLTQKQLGDQLFVYKSTIARWESGSRLPDAAMIPRIAKCLNVDPNRLFQLAAENDETPNVIMVDDNEIICILYLEIVIFKLQPGGCLPSWKLHRKPKRFVHI